MDDSTEFSEMVSANIGKLAGDSDVQALSRIWVREIAPYQYTYNFSWLGRPIIQFPQDVMALQEIIWKVKPRVIVETGVARGGSTVFFSSMLQLLGGERKVVAVDIDIRNHNRKHIEASPFAERIQLLEGSSVSEETRDRVFAGVGDGSPVLVVLDSNHTHEHVLQELEFYAPLVGKGSYLVVLDTLIEDMPENSFPDRPWGKGNNPKTAVMEFLETNPRFVIDKEYDHKLLISCAPSGYLRCIDD